MQSWKDNEKTKPREEEMLQVVTFTLGSEHFAFDILQVKEIIRLSKITQVPKAPAFIEGVINLRGRIIPIVDQRKRFSFPCENNKKTRIVVTEVSEEMIGFIVDTVSETRSIAKSAVEIPPDLIIKGIDSECIQGVAKLDDRLLILLDIDQILSLSEQQALKEG